MAKCSNISRSAVVEYAIHALPILRKMVKNMKLSSVLPFHIVWYETKHLPVKLVYCKNSIFL